MPTSSQNTNIIARLPAMQMPSIENENSEKYWKKRWNRPRRCRCSPSASVTSWSTYVVQLVVHVAEGVDVDARGDQRHHAEHGDGERVDVVADRELQACRTGPACTNRRRCRAAGRCCARACCAASSECSLGLHRRQAKRRRAVPATRRSSGCFLAVMRGASSGCAGSHMPNSE